MAPSNANDADPVSAPLRSAPLRAGALVAESHDSLRCTRIRDVQSGQVFARKRHFYDGLSTSLYLDLRKNAFEPSFLSFLFFYVVSYFPFQARRIFLHASFVISSAKYSLKIQILIIVARFFIHQLRNSDLIFFNSFFNSLDICEINFSEISIFERIQKLGRIYLFPFS